MPEVRMKGALAKTKTPSPEWITVWRRRRMSGGR